MVLLSSCNEHKSKLKILYLLKSVRKVKHIGLNLARRAQDLHVKNYMLMEEDKGDLNQCKDSIFRDWKAKQRKILIFPKSISRFIIISN
jgi:hypothetical protein